MWRLLFLPLVLAVAGCPLGVATVADFPCASSQDCAAGYRCEGGLCSVGIVDPLGPDGERDGGHATERDAGSDSDGGGGDGAGEDGGPADAGPTDGGAADAGCVDDDGDGVCDAEDACLGFDDALDTDGDLLPDGCDDDDDGDGVADDVDLQALDPTVCRDLDADGCDDCTSGVDDPANDGPDSDNDGVCDVGDNCERVANADQADAELDGIGDACSRTCHDILLAAESRGDGLYNIDPDGPGGEAPFAAYCDMSTDGGGWTILYATSGGDGEVPLVSDLPVAGDPFIIESHNLGRAHKVALSAVSSQTLFVRSEGAFLRASAAPFDDRLLVAGSHTHKAVRVTASDGSVAQANMGWTVANIQYGGDFHLNRVGLFGTGLGVDHHSALYYHLNGSCFGQYLYSYSAAGADGDAGYDVNVALGDWGRTVSCQVAEGGTLAFRVGVRPAPPDGPIAVYRFDEGSGTAVLDSSGHGYDGTHAASYTPGVSGTALLFDGTRYAPGAVIEAMNEEGLALGADGGEFTILYWLRLDAAVAYWVTPFRKTDPTGNNSPRSIVQFLYPATLQLIPSIQTTVSNNDFHYSATLPTGTWAHVAAVHRGDQYEIYVDGDLVSADTLEALTHGGRGRIYLGGDPFYGQIQGAMDEVKLYDRALSFDEIVADRDNPGG